MTLKYEPGCPAEWNDGVKAFTAKWTSVADSRRFLLTGPCPRCRHPISKELTDQIGVGLAAPNEPIQVRVTCTCGEVHPGAPAGAPSGCGAWGTVIIERG